MKIILLLSWRNLWRNRRRSLVVITSIALGIFAMIFSMGFMNGMNAQMVENTISTSLGHIAIHMEGFHENMKLERHFTANDEVLQAISGVSSIQAYAPKLTVQGMVRSAETSRGVMIVGIDPAREHLVSKISSYTSSENGSRFLENSDADEVLISRSLARKLDLTVGDRLVLMVQDLHNEIIGEGLVVTGLFESPMESFDKYTVFVGLKKLQRITGLGGAISGLTLLLADKDRILPERNRLRKALQGRGLEVLSWQDMAPNLVKAVALFDAMMYIFFAIVFATVIFSIANTLIMAVMERFHEIGVMKSIGTRPSRVFAMILFEAVNLGLVGLAAGITAGMALTWILGLTGINLSFYMESMRTWGTGSVIYPAIKPTDIAVSAAIVLTTTIAAALYPALKAARIKPLDALHFI